MKIRISELRRLIREALISDYELGVKGGSFVGTPISEWSVEQVMGAWGKHAKNRYELMFYLKNGTADEKMQASNELEVCDRKLEFWEKHPQFDKRTAREIDSELARKWESQQTVLDRRKVVPPSKSQVSSRQKPTFAPPTAMSAPRSAGAERVVHEKFGPGTVVKKLGGDKVQVVFDDKKLGGVAKVMSSSFLSPARGGV